MVTAVRASGALCVAFAMALSAAVVWVAVAGSDDERVVTATVESARAAEEYAQTDSPGARWAARGSTAGVSRDDGLPPTLGDADRRTAVEILEADADFRRVVDDVTYGLDVQPWIGPRDDLLGAFVVVTTDAPVELPFGLPTRPLGRDDEGNVVPPSPDDPSDQVVPAPYRVVDVTRVEVSVDLSEGRVALIEPDPAMHRAAPDKFEWLPGTGP